MDMWGILAGWGVLSYFEYVLKVLVILLKPFGVVYYKISFDKEVHLKTLNLISNEAITSGECVIRGNKRLPYGYFMNRKSIGFIDLDMSYLDASKITIITTRNYYEYITSLNDEPPSFSSSLRIEDTCVAKEECCKIVVFNRCGKYEDLVYVKLKIDVKDLTPFETQFPIVEDIVRMFNTRKVVRVFIEGIPGSGKSSIGYCVAKALHGKFTHSFNPTDPGDTFGGVISTMNYDDIESANVIVIEEADVLLNKLHYGRIIQNDRISTMVKDKASWNAFLDDMVFYKHTVLILTSNTPKEQIDKLDPAYIRPGRIDLFYKMSTVIPV
jgi:ATPase family associated with various cellular activities (AAA)